MTKRVQIGYDRKGANDRDQRVQMVVTERLQISYDKKVQMCRDS